MTLADRLQALRTDLEAAIAAHTATPVTADEREHLKQRIIALFREADAALAQAQAAKDAVKGLAEQWKQLDGRGAPAESPARATPAVGTTVVGASGSGSTARVDHLGASTFVEKGWSRLSLNDAAGAEVALRRALELAPGDPDTEALLGWALMVQEQYDQALLVLQNVLLRHPQHALARTNVGYICLRKGIYGEAIEHLSSAIRADTDRKATLYAHLYLGLAYREREMVDDAVAFFRRALELGPNLLQAWYELGRTCWQANRRSDALAAWKSGAEANKFSPWGKRCAEMLTLVEQGGEPPREG